MLLPLPASGTDVGILPAHAPTVLASQLNRGLGPLLSSLRAPDGPGRPQEHVIEPSALSQRLADNREVARRLKAALAAVKAAEHHALHMLRTRALGAAGTSLDHLNRIAARHHAPRLVARAQTARALACLLKPADQKEALSALVEAASTDPAYNPDTDRFPSRARRLLARARLLRQPTPPTERELKTLAALAQVQHLIWSAVVEQQGALLVNLVIYDARRGMVLASETMPCLGCALVQMVATRISDRLGDPPPPIPIPLLHPARRRRIPERPDRGARTGVPPRRGARTGIPSKRAD